MYFLNYLLRNTLLDKWLKTHASENSSRSNMVNSSKKCCNLNNSIFTILIDHSEGN